jgi:hypothetical protein
MATVIPLLEHSGGTSSPPRGRNVPPAKILSLRDRLFERAVEEAWARRLADERETAQESAQFRPRLRVVRP